MIFFTQGATSEFTVGESTDERGGGSQKKVVSDTDLDIGFGLNVDEDETTSVSGQSALQLGDASLAERACNALLLTAPKVFLAAETALRRCCTLSQATVAERMLETLNVGPNACISKRLALFLRCVNKDASYFASILGQPL